MGSLRKKLPKDAKALKEEALMLCNGVTFDFIAISKVSSTATCTTNKHVSRMHCQTIRSCYCMQCSYSI